MRLKALSSLMAVLLAALPFSRAFAAASAEPSSKNVFLNAAIRLYDQAEFEQALGQLKKAENMNNTAAVEVEIHVWEGIVQFDLNHKDEAETQFKTALALDPKVQLPKKISPKTRAMFERVRTEMPAAPTVAPAPDVPPAEPPKPEAPTSAPPVVIREGAPAPEKQGPSVAPWVLVGLGVVLAGTGAFFCSRAKSQGNDANAARFQSDADSMLSSAKTDATIGYVGLGAGGAALIAGGVMFLASGSSGPATSTQAGSDSAQ